MSVKKKLGLPTGKLIAIAGLAGLLAGGAAIYVKESLSGNGAVASADPAACALAAEKTAALTPFSKGQVAAMRSVDEHRPLPDLVFNGPDDIADAAEITDLHRAIRENDMEEVVSILSGPDGSKLARAKNYYGNKFILIEEERDLFIFSLFSFTSQD